MRNCTLFMALVVACLAFTPAASANLLTNGGFEAAPPCSLGWAAAPGTNNCTWDGTTHMPNPLNYEGSHHASSDVGTHEARKATIYQTVTVLPGATLHLTGAIAGATNAGPCTWFVRLHDGPSYDPAVSPVLDQLQFTGQYFNNWQVANLTGVPTGTQVTVAWGYDKPASLWTITAVHGDAFNLIQDQPTCQGGDPAVIAFTPTFGANNGPCPITVSGTAFAADSQVKLRRVGFSDIEATGEVVTGDTQITCTLPLAGLAMGRWSIVVTKPNCNDGIASADFIVANVDIDNGSFENPFATPACPIPTQQGAPSGWLEIGVSTMTNHLVRDSNQYVPSCPLPDGDQYASILVPQGTSIGFWSVYQYLAVTPGQPLSVCGSFAGGGHTTVKLIIREGDENGPTIGERLIEDRTGCPVHAYDWVPACVTAPSPTSGLVTLDWQLLPHRSGSVVNAAHADNLRITTPAAEVCDNGIDDDGDRRTDCQDPDCLAFPGCDPPPAEICNNGLDDDGDVRIDCDDSDCDSVCVEICNNGIDDDYDCDVDLDDSECEDCTNGVDDNGDGLVDCDDPTCLGHEACPSEICTDGIDNNGDTLIDCADPGCAQHPHCKGNDPFADADGDGDVDQADFAVVQLCFTGSNVTMAIGCGMFDRDFDRDIDQSDMNAFELCASGPGVPASTACDGGQ